MAFKRYLEDSYRKKSCWLVRAYAVTHRYITFSKMKYRQSTLILRQAPLFCLLCLALQCELTGCEELGAALRNQGAVTRCFGLTVTTACTLLRTQYYAWSFLVVTRSLAEPYLFNTIFGNVEVRFERETSPMFSCVVGGTVWEVVEHLQRGIRADGHPGRWTSVEVEGEVYSFLLP